MSFISTITENVSFYVGRQLDVVATGTKRWAVVAGLVSGWALGLFFVSKSFLPKPAAFALMSICSYAMGHFASDTVYCISALAKWLLNQGGERGRRYLASVSAHYRAS